MPKIYDQKDAPERDMEERTTPSGGVPDKVQKRDMVLIVVAILAVVLIVLFYRMARGDEIVGATILSEPWAVITTALF